MDMKKFIIYKEGNEKEIKDIAQVWVGTWGVGQEREEAEKGEAQESADHELWLDRSIILQCRLKIHCDMYCKYFEMVVGKSDERTGLNM